MSITWKKTIIYFIETRKRRKSWNISFIGNKIEKNFWILNVELLFLTSRHSSSIISKYVSCPFGFFQCGFRSTFNRLILSICVNVGSENWFYFSKSFYFSLIKLLTKSKFELMQTNRYEILTNISRRMDLNISSHDDRRGKKKNQFQYIARSDIITEKSLVIKLRFCQEIHPTPN